MLAPADEGWHNAAASEVGGVVRRVRTCENAVVHPPGPALVTPSSRPRWYTVYFYFSVDVKSVFYLLVVH